MGCRYRLDDEEFLDIARRLQKVGCPLQKEAIRALHKVEIVQCGVCRVFDLKTGGTGFEAEVAVTALKPGVFIAEYELLVPWDDPYFVWLEYNKNAPEYPEYSFRREERLDYPRQLVLNDKKGHLRRGDCWVGILVGYSAKLIPEAYQRGGIHATLRLSSNLGELASTTVVLAVDRRPRPQLRRPQRRSGLFGPADTNQSLGERRRELARYIPPVLNNVRTSEAERS